LKISVKDTEYQKSLEDFREGYKIPKKSLNISVKDTEYQKSLEDFCEGYKVPKKSSIFP